MKLTYPLLLNAKPKARRYKLSDRDSLYLLVSITGTKTWRFDYRLDGKACTYTLGRFPDLSLHDAREMRSNAAKLVGAGIHPRAHERQLQQQTIAHHKNTLWPVCEEWLNDNRANWTAYYHGQATRILTRYVKGSPLGTMPVRDIKVAQVYDLLQSIAKRKTVAGDERKAEGAPHIAIRCVNTLTLYSGGQLSAGSGHESRCSAQTIRCGDAAAYAPQSGVVADELKHLLAALSITGTPLTRLAMRLLLLTSVRTAELRGSTWKEIVLESAIWAIPGERMKMGHPHVVPLSTQAIVILKEVREITQTKSADDYLFPNVRDRSRPMAATTINAALVRAGFNHERLFRAHGTRGTFSTWAYEQGFTPLAVERQLAHVEKNRVSRAYNKAEFLPERQRMMQNWGDYLQNMSN